MSMVRGLAWSLRYSFPVFEREGIRLLREFG
jgi:hypothetical protein